MCLSIPGAYGLFRRLQEIGNGWNGRCGGRNLNGYECRIALVLGMQVWLC